MRRTWVTYDNFNQCWEEIRAASCMSVDTETTGLRPYHGDVPFIVVIGLPEQTFLFCDRNELLEYKEYGLSRDAFAQIPILLSDCPGTKFMHNAKFDLHMLGSSEIRKVICTKATARILNNELFDYSLDACASKIGFPKDSAVEKWIEENKAFDVVTIPGKSTKKKNKHFWKVPKDMMFDYACRDAEITLALGLWQLQQIKEQSESDQAKLNPGPESVLANESILTDTIFHMEKKGVLIDPDAVMHMIEHESLRYRTAEEEFSLLTGKKYMASPKLFAEIFSGEKPKWKYTEKNNPSFNSDALALFDHPAAKSVLVLRDAKSRLDFLHGFRHHRDKTGRVHPNFNQDGTATGRFSSSDPNFQNLTNESPRRCAVCDAGFDYVSDVSCPTCGSDKYLDVPYMLRSAIVPPPGRWLLSLDYQAMEYRMMLELAARLRGAPGNLLNAVRYGKDVHTATAELASKSGVTISRSTAKMANFLTIYGGGAAKLAAGLKCSVAEAQAIRAAIFAASPETKALIQGVMSTAETRGYVRNWLGRRSYFPNKDFVYKAPNYLIQGGCADVMKIAMNRIHRESFFGCDMVMTIHDELIFEVTPEFVSGGGVRRLQEIMVDSFPHKYLPMATSAAIGKRNLAELEEYE